MKGDTLQMHARDRVEELPGAGLEHPFGPDWDVFKVRGKVFMLLTEITGEPIVIVKADPEDAKALREQHEEITPGYHMNKQHWITLNPGGHLQKSLVDDLVTESYLLVVENLPRAKRPVDPGTFGTERTVTLSGEQLQQHARDTAVSLADVTAGHPFTPHLEVWKVHDKVFLIVTDDDPDRQIVTLKVDPHHGDALRRDFDTITIGQYLDKQHWISIGPGSGITKQLIEDLVHGSHDLADDRPRERRS